ncbi:Methylenetetrahydrofolate reductase family protein [Leishmania donovani]|uniref:Methylenetetrahydrofolate reductase family protein n=1 Tax=Leishmania donovani TaxID=5661 RepID=A0A504XL87_LEIDO|nr:Methylenetetrahydrofolate reductase family protein [Leishmania donovani]
MVKISGTMKQAVGNSRPFVSFEFVASTTEDGAIKLHETAERLPALDPLFCGITWGNHLRTAETSIEVASTFKAKGVRNLLVTRGAPTAGFTTEPRNRGTDVGSRAAAAGAHDSSREEADATTSTFLAFIAAAPSSSSSGSVFPHAVDLIRFVHQHFGDYFGMVVAAFPEGGLSGNESSDDAAAWISARRDTELLFLKKKLSAGADYVVTQGIFDVRQLKLFGVHRISGAVDLRRRIESSKTNDSEVKYVVVAFQQPLVKRLLARGCGGVYFFHREYGSPSYMMYAAHRRGTMEKRWNALLVSPHSGTLALGEAGVYHARLLLGSRPKPCTQFPMIQGMAELQTALTELSRIFQAFLDGRGTRPYADELPGETVYVEHLLKLPNAQGLYTINSQPPVNGVPSPDSSYVYQKSYVEFLCHLPSAPIVFTTLDKCPELQYTAMSAQGNVARVTAITWGVFSRARGDSNPLSPPWTRFARVGVAFAMWAAPFPPNDVPTVAHYIQTEFVLVRVVDNVLQEPLTPLEHAVVEICPEIPLLTLLDATQPHPKSSLTFAPDGDALMNALGQFVRAS